MTILGHSGWHLESNPKTSSDGSRLPLHPKKKCIITWCNFIYHFFQVRLIMKVHKEKKKRKKMNFIVDKWLEYKKLGSATKVDSLLISWYLHCTLFRNKTLRNETKWRSASIYLLIEKKNKKIVYTKKKKVHKKTGVSLKLGYLLPIGNVWGANFYQSPWGIFTTGRSSAATRSLMAM